MKNVFAILSLCGVLLAQSGSSGSISATSTAANDLGKNGVVVSFTATPPNKTFTKFHWDFEPNMTAEGQAVSHRFTHPADYAVHLRMSDDSGSQQVSSEIHVRVNRPVEIAQ